MSSYQGRGRGRGRSGGRGRDSGGNRHHHNSSTQGRGGGAALPSRLRLCRYFTNGNGCGNNQCKFSHSIKLHATLGASNPVSSSHQQDQQRQDHQGYNNNGGHRNDLFPVGDVAIWEQQNAGIKIFTGSHDGHWRLWVPSQNMAKEAEVSMGGGKIECVVVASNYLFCGFEGTSVKVPGVTVGMIHAWNLNAPSDAPFEFHMGPLAPYAHASGVSAFLTQNDMCISGSHDGVIRIWKYDPSGNGGKGLFILVNTLCGHAGEITGLVIVQNVLWSSSTDMTIRLWDMTTCECKYLITKDTLPSNGQQPVPGGSGGVGHSGAITCLLPFESQVGSFVLSSSLDGDVKVWNSSNGEFMVSTNHGTAVTTMALSADLKGNPILLCGTDIGNIMIRSVLQTQNAPALSLLCTLESFHSCGHSDAVKSIKPGPSNTFYSGGSDGNLMVWEITGDMGM